MKFLFSILILLMFRVAKSNKLTDDIKMLKFHGMKTKSISCQPNVTYIHNTVHCVCTKNGNWPNNNCASIFDKLYSNRTLNENCKPNSYVVVQCNVCKCNEKGKLDYKRCTKHVCESSSKSRRSRKSTETFKEKCVANNWYSFAPCQLCYCINGNKLVCSKSNKQSKTLPLGMYNVTVCGESFLKDAINLMSGDKSILGLGYDRKVRPSAILKKVNPMTEEIYDEDRGVLMSARNKVDEESSDSEYDESEIYAQRNKIDSRTQMPYEKFDNKDVSDETDEKENSNLSSKINSKEENSQIYVKPTITLPERSVAKDDKFPPKTINLTEKITNNTEAVQNEKSSLFGVNLPSMLRNVFDLGKRKFGVRKMVSLDSSNTCEPGTTTVVECNSCYCMKNGKLLCTMKSCLGIKS